ncbi:MAG: hypothetical protein Q9195_000776 [Heterodermia aff. obscurata]
MNKFISRAKVGIKIVLNDQEEAFVPSYTSLDEIGGEVSITAPSSIAFDQVYITFEGSAKTSIEKVASTAPTTGKTEAFQSFLRLVQPIDDAVFPEPRVFEEGHKYTFPFTFNVPEQLLPQSCTHPRESDVVHEEHLHLPPSLGDPLVASEDGKTLLDDMAPDMGVISYALKVRITKGRGPNGKHLILNEESRRLRVIPASHEAPPLSVQGGQIDDYRLRKEKDIKKGMFKGKLGRLTMESVQPKSLRLPPVRGEARCPITTMATVNLRFDPANENAEPPRLNQLNAKLKVSTFFASVPMKEIPARANDFHYSSTRGIYTDTVNLSSRCLGSVQWEYHSTISTPIRRDSAFSTLSGRGTAMPSPSESYNGKSFYTATILVPITISKGNKTFTPTFHSCLVSRVYGLCLQLSAHGPGFMPTLNLKLPIQMTAEGNVNARPSISDEEAAAIAAREANGVFQPRSIAPPRPEYIARGPQVLGVNIASPEYPPGSNHGEHRQPVVHFDRDYDSDHGENAPPPGYSSFSLNRRTQSLAV